MNQYALYLRKSRADLDAEQRGEGETLAKHRAALTEYANRRGLYIAREYAEIISGDSIAARPQMQALLEDVKAGLYAGVIVNDIDRLGRGDSIDQEIIKTTFAVSRCLIITPSRDIDLSNPSDDDMMDFSQFMARFEYKKIAQRMQQGRRRSAASGSYVAGTAPLGYRIVKAGHRYHLEIDETEAPVVRVIFDLYVNQGKSLYGAAQALNEMGYRSRKGFLFTYDRVRAILVNRAYIGDVQWGKRQTYKTIDPDGVRREHSRKGENIITAYGAHEPIISRELFDAAQARIASRAPKVKTSLKMRNPLAGLLYCSHCGKSMPAYKPDQYNPHGRLVVKCHTPQCPTRSRPLNYIIDAIMETMRDWCAEYAESQPAPQASKIDDLAKQIAVIDGQLTRAHELVEQGIYSVQEYIARRDLLQSQRESVQAQLEETKLPAAAAMAALIPQVKTVLDAYPLAATPAEQNRLLKSVISKIIYTRDALSDPVHLEIFPKIK